MRLKYVLLLLLASLCLSCGQKQAKIDPTKQNDSQLYQLGQQELKDGNYLKAREAFKAVFENFPKSDYRILAKLAYADSFFQDGGEANYVIAIQEYQDFISLFPFSPKAEYAQFQVGMCYYNMAEKPDRDQTNTRKALEAFRKTIESYPAGEHFKDASNMVLQCDSRLAEHEFDVAFYYYRTEHYQAVVDRLKKLLKDYPEGVHEPMYLYFLASALEKLGQASESCVYYDQILKKWKSSDYNEKAQQAKTRICK